MLWSAEHNAKTIKEIGLAALFTLTRTVGFWWRRLVIMSTHLVMRAESGRLPRSRISAVTTTPGHRAVHEKVMRAMWTLRRRWHISKCSRIRKEGKDSTVHLDSNPHLFKTFVANGRAWAHAACPAPIRYISLAPDPSTHIRLCTICFLQWEEINAIRKDLAITEFSTTCEYASALDVAWRILLVK